MDWILEGDGPFQTSLREYRGSGAERLCSGSTCVIERVGGVIWEVCTRSDPAFSEEPTPSET